MHGDKDEILRLYWIFVITQEIAPHSGTSDCRVAAAARSARVSLSLVNGSQKQYKHLKKNLHKMPDCQLSSNKLLYIIPLPDSIISIGIRTRCPFISHQNSWQGSHFQSAVCVAKCRLVNPFKTFKGDVYLAPNMQCLLAQNTSFSVSFCRQGVCKNFYASRQQRQDVRDAQGQKLSRKRRSQVYSGSACSWLVVRRPVTTLRVGTKSSVVCLAQPVDAGVQLALMD